MAAKTGVTKKRHPNKIIQQRGNIFFIACPKINEYSIAEVSIANYRSGEKENCVPSVVSVIVPCLSVRQIVLLARSNRFKTRGDG